LNKFQSMIFNRKFLVVACMAAVVTTAVAFTDPLPDDPLYKNLKVLPKDISKEKLDKIMFGFKDALGVKCSYCHAKSQDTTVRHPDFASDEKPEKEIARSMMKMTLKINKSFFEVKHPAFGEPGLQISCVTCHHGEPHPEEPKEPEHGPGPGGVPPPPPPGGEKQ
jgi:Photosynthetic reaction centre cytochrome C subunit